MSNRKILRKTAIILGALAIFCLPKTFAADQPGAATRSRSANTTDTYANDGAKRKATGETASADDPNSTTARTKPARINLNTADRAALETLPGVGPSTANAIIAARPFKSVEDLKRVDGIGDVRFAELKSKVMVSHDHPNAVGSAATRPSSGSGVSSGETGANNSSYATGSRAKTKPSMTGKINLNTATKEQLDALPGIGPVKSQAIIDARPFKTPEDVKKVRGIKEGEYAKIRDLITVK